MKRVSKTSMLETLDAVRQQLVTSYDGIAELCHQHKEWQRSVENMIRRFENDVSQPVLKTLAEEEQPALEDGSAGIAGDSAENPDQPPPNAVGEERDAPIESRARDSRLTQDTQITLGTLQSSNQMSPDRSHRYKRAHLHRAGRMSAIHPLLQSRKTVQQCPAGPLRKLLSDMLAKSEDTPSEPLSQIDRARRWAASLVSSPRFDYIAGFVILLNLVTIGFEAELSLEGSEYESGFWFAGVERMFLSIYIAEAAFRLFALGLPLLYDRWFILDLVLICTGAVALLIIPLASEELAGFEKVLVARGLRLLRLLRVLRMVHQFKIIWRLVYGFLTAWETIFASALLIIISLFIFACIAVEAIELIAKDHQLQQDETTRDILSGNFAGLPSTLLTLLQFVTLDDVADVYFPLIMAKPYLCAFFFPILMFISVGLMNLVTASLVENAMQTAALEAEEERLKLKKKVKNALPSLIEIFHQLDADHSGLITHDEVENVPVSILPPRVLDSICVENMADIFDYLDVDGTGELTQMEFVEGLLNLCLLDMPISTIQCLKLLQLLRGGLGRMDEKMHVLGAQVSELHDNICGSVIRNVRV